MLGEKRERHVARNPERMKPWRRGRKRGWGVAWARRAMAGCRWRRSQVMATELAEAVRVGG
jgi:hypothetical protein